ncbi:fused MFS/spermidine synthase [Bacteroidota bacterium]
MKVNNKSSLFFGIVALGFCSFITQLVLMREYLSVFSGNEFIIGIYLAGWMMLNGAGAYWARRSSKKANTIPLIIRSFIFLAIIPFVSLLAFYLVNSQFFPPGYSPGPLSIWFYMLILIAPFCFISGSLFVYMSREISKVKNEAISFSYGIESFGSIIGGLLFTFILLNFFNSFQIIAIVFGILFFSALFLIAGNGKQLLANSLGGLGSTVLFILIFVDFYPGMRDQLYYGQDLLSSNDNKYSKIDITQNQSQINVYENFDLVYTNSPSVLTEEIIHFPLALHPSPEKILLIGGGISGSLQEILKYNPEVIDHPENSKEIIELIKNSFDDKVPDNIKIFNEDPRRFIKNNAAKYDVIICDISDPVSANLNKYYSKEFFEEVKAVLNTDGIFILSLESPGHYLDDESQFLLSVIYNTLNVEFKNVKMLASGKNYLLGSNSNFESDIIEQITAKGIENSFVNQYRMSTANIDFKSNQIESALIKETGINTDSNPVAYYYRIQHWTNQYGLGIHYLLLIPLIAGLIFFLLQKTLNQGLFISGFTGASFEFVILIMFQISSGSLYFYSALLISLFMAGIVLGSLYSGKIIKAGINNFILIFIIFGISISMIIYLLASNFLPDNESLTFAAYLFLISITGFYTGIIFKLGTQLNKATKVEVKASSAYGSDLMGAALGIFLTSVYIIPFWGIRFTCVILAGINIIYALYVYIRKKSLSV